ncbi:hypothetical protein NLU13_3468 [Sarocladium strictum]|uniref:Uncharacterized protein n=1 Tax=Sarocladium strictum TaxID=5046 RepID=A0AA39GM27_SARSR|nr:hypothetical protein NLU13_3468 [Sarocladium strictum]
MSGFLGSRISLISKSDIRYVGTLHEINSDESTVSLENVRSFGSEGRKGNPDEEIAPSDQVYEYIVFRGSDVKDLRIEEQPTGKENQPAAMPNDPAIVGAQAKPRDQPLNQNAPGMYGQPQYPPPNNFYGGPPPPGQWGPGGAPPAFGNMPYPPPPGWYPPGQGFPHGGPGGPPGPGGPAPWSNPNFPPGPGGPPGGPLGPSGSQQGQQKASTPSQAPQTEPKPLAQPNRQQGKAPSPPVASKPSAEEVKQTAENLTEAASQVGKTARVPPAGPRNSRPNPVIPLGGPAQKPFSLGENKNGQATIQTTVSAQPPTSVQDATSAARAAVAVAMAQLGNSGGNTMDNLTNKVNEMKVNAERGGAAGRGRGRGNRTGPVGAAKVDVPDSDFDFMQSNAKFNKQDIVKEAVAGSPPAETPNGDGTPEPEEPVTASGAQVAYNKSSSFFDNISSEARERAENGGQKPGGREWRGEEQRKNMETFGQGSVDGGYRNFRGRGRGRGGRGRGYGRGRGGPRPPYQQQGGDQ